jgi:hypothetical protein
MERSLLIPICAVAAIVIAALSLGPSFAHALEAPPRLKVWSPELWRETTVFNGQFRLFLAVGAPLDMAAILAPAIMAFAVRDDPRSCLLFVAAAAFYAVALALWFGLVAPANAVLATWTPGPIPADFRAVQWRWETGHMAVAAAKLVGFVFAALALIAIGARQISS